MYLAPTPSSSTSTRLSYPAPFRYNVASMHLRKLTLQGFKTFAQKTTLTFPAGVANNHALTIIVGPNGSGKSNIADAIRWCLGEQSMKQLRGKQSQDVIFSGSDGKHRQNMAEVSLTFDNPKHVGGITLSEIVITRQLFRDGESHYLLNGKEVRLADIQLLLAEAGIGQRTYTVIAQGMIDHILTASPEERKVFFDDATGVRGLQIRRQQAMGKLRHSTELMVEAERLLKEIEPRLKLLERQAKRLEERQEVESALKEIQTLYYGAIWREQETELKAFDGHIASCDASIARISSTIQEGDSALARMENEQEDQTSVNESAQRRAKLQQQYSNAQRAHREAQHAVYEAERNLEIQKVRAQSRWSPLPLKDILAELDAMLTKGESLTISDLLKLIRSLKTKLTKPKPEDITLDPALTEEVQRSKQALADTRRTVEQLEDELTREAKVSSAPAQINKELFQLQRDLREAQNALHAEESKKHQLLIERTRIETRREDLLAELSELNLSLANITQYEPETPQSTHILKEKLTQLQRKRDLIGGIDPEIVAEYQETKERHHFLNTQLTDLHEAINASERVIDELDASIKSQSEGAFEAINKQFQLYFKILFGGGKCELTPLKREESESTNVDITPERGIHELIDSIEVERTASEQALERFEAREDHVAGIEIYATPPGKTLKSLTALSGGERALTAIALLSAIMATNPSPFVVLDEVDASLDESNTVRFANILSELRKHTQFIVVTHNRATMERGDMLYGVTMGNDGMSTLLSVNLKDIEETLTARR